MDGLGEKMRQRARELGLTDTEVARRLGLSQARYAHYVNNKREPDFRTFVNICRILSTSPDALLNTDTPHQPPGFSEDAPPSGLTAWRDPSCEATNLRDRIKATAEAMTVPTLRIAATVMDALVRNEPEE